MTRPDVRSRTVRAATAVLLAPLVLLYGIAGYFLYLALTIRPDGPWDHAAESGTVLSCLITVASSAAACGYYTVLVTPRVHAGRLWLVTGQVLAIVAAMRWLTLN